MKNHTNSKELYLFIAIGIIIFILISAIFWFQYILTTPTVWFNTISYEDFLIKYYTNQNNWLNFGLYIITIILAVMGIVFAIDYKTKREELEKYVDSKLSSLDYVTDCYQSPKEDSFSKVNSWYEKYKSGKILQGGNLNINNTDAERQIYFLQTFKTDNYSFFYNVLSADADSQVEISIKELSKSHIMLSIKTIRQTNKQIMISWYARGF